MSKDRFFLKTHYIFVALLAFFIGSLIYLQATNIRAAYYGCPTSQQNGNKAYFSQFYEDYILSIVFADLKDGTYIDAGAYDPQSSSVTEYFYNEGWHGINIEPLHANYLKFVKERPRDVNLNTGVGDKIGKLTFYKIIKTGLSTYDKAVAEQAKEDGFMLTEEYLPMTTLNQILKEHPLPQINFLKIDVEGYEKQVLQGLNFKTYRPQVLVVEATAPRTQQPVYQHWEPFILANQYHFAFFDGLNRYYVADEHPELFAKFALVKTCLEVSLNSKLPSGERASP